MKRTLTVFALVLAIPTLAAAQHAGYGTSDVVRMRHPIVPTASLARGLHVRGPLPSAVVRRVLLRHLPEVRFCYEDSLRSVPDLAGSVVVRFTIGPTGGVTAAELVSSTFHVDAVTECLVRATQRWAFPASTADVVVEAPYALAQRRQ